MTHATAHAAAPADRPTAFESLVAASDLEQAALTQLQTWLPSYLWEVERQHGQAPGTLAQPRGWVLSGGIEKFPEDQTPAIIIASPGTTDPPQADGAGVYTARWRLGVAAELVARGNRIALTLARLYAAAIRGVLLQQQDLPGLQVRRVDWDGETYDTIDTIDDRTVCIAEVTVAVEVSDVLTRHAGPLEPMLPPDPNPAPVSPTWPRATDIDIVITKEEP